MAANPLIPISKTLGAIKYTAGLTQKTLRGMSTILSEKRSDRRVISSSIKILKQRRVQDTKRRNTQEVISAPTVVTRYKGPALLAQRSDNASFTSRIMGFLGYLAAGWALRNLPTWTAIGSQLIKRIGETSSVMVQLGSTIQNFIFDIGGLFEAAFANLKQFDFTDGSGRLRSSLDELSGTIMTMGDQLEEALSILTQPFLDVPPLGSRSEKPSAYDRKPEPPTPPSGGGSGKWKPLLDLISSGESAGGGYSAMYPGESHPQILNMSVAEVIQFQKQKLKDGRKSAAIGRYQMLYPEKYAAAAGLPLTTKFSPENQDKMAIAYLKKNRKLAEWDQGKISDEALSEELAREFGAFRSASGYVLPGNTGSIKFNKLKTVLQKIKSQPSSVQTTPTAPLPAGFDPNKRYRKDQTVPSGADVGAVITSRRGWRWGGMHGGIDVAMPIGTYVTCKYPCVIREAKYEYGYGYYLDVVIPALSIRIRLAHLSPRSYYFKGYPSAINGLNIEWPAGKPLVKSGQTGRVTGPHLHLEATKNMKGVSNGASDPNAVEPDPYVDAFIYSSNPPGGIEPVIDGKNLKGKPSATSTTTVDGYSTNVATSEGEIQIDSASLTTFSKLLQNLTTEQKGRKVVVIDDRKPTPPPMILSAGGDIAISSGVDEFTLVNNFMKNKLLLDLTYL